jgi:putative transposase
VPTRRVDELMQAMGLSGISKSQVSKLCKDIDERVNAFLDRPLDGEWPYLWLDATYLKVRDGGRIVSVAGIIAMAVSSDGRREIVGLGIGPSEAEPFWSGLLKGLVKRGLKGVNLVDLGRSRRAAPCSAPLGKDSEFIGSGMRSRTCPRASTRWLPPRFGKPFCRPMPTPRTRPGDTSPTSCAAAGQSSHPDGRQRARRAGLHDVPRPAPDGRNCTAPTRSNDSTRRSSDAPTSSASSQMRRASPG